MVMVDIIHQLLAVKCVVLIVTKQLVNINAIMVIPTCPHGGVATHQ